MLTDHGLKKDVGPEGTRSLGERREPRGLEVRERQTMGNGAESNWDRDSSLREAHPGA